MRTAVPAVWLILLPLDVNDTIPLWVVSVFDNDGIVAVAVAIPDNVAKLIQLDVVTPDIETFLRAEVPNGTCKAFAPPENVATPESEKSVADSVPAIVAVV